MKTRILLFAAACALPAPLAAQTQPGVMVNERFALSDKAAGDLARKDLEAMLAARGRFGAGEGQTLEASLFTTPVSTDYPGLCQRDEIRISYARVGTGADVKFRPLSVDTYRQYRAVRDRLAFPQEIERYRLDRFPADCAAAGNGPDDGWFGAWYSYEAARGYTALATALERVRAGTLQIGNCDRDSDVKMRCAQLLNAPARDRMFRLARCSQETADRCFDISTMDARVTIRVADRAYPITPDKIESIAIFFESPGIQ